MPFNFGRPIRIQPYFGYRNDTRLVIEARALRSGKPDFKPAGRFQAMRTMLAQFASREVAELPVTLTIERADGEIFTYETITNGEGFAHFDVPLSGDWPAAEHTTWELVSLSWRDGADELSVQGHVLVPGTAARLAVVSDIDDTIIETGITGSLKAIARNWRRVVMQLPEERVAVPGVDAFYNAIGGGSVLESDEHPATGARIAASRHPFFYVSSSPYNLFSYLVAFKRMRGVPLGPIKLRDWGFNRATLGSSSHGAHKKEAIAEIIDHFPDLVFALIGDDTQGDLTAFGDIVREMPERIAAVFIRKAAEEDYSPEEYAAKDAIRAAGKPLWLGPDYSTGEAFLREIGLFGDDDAEAIIASATGMASRNAKRAEDAPPGSISQ